MSGRLRRITGYQREYLASGWELAAATAGSIDSPSDPRCQQLSWLGPAAPGTAAAMLRAAGEWSLEGPERRFDAEDWWYRIRFPRPGHSASLARASPVVTFLGFDGLATVVQVWLNGSHILSSDNMFISHELDIGAQLQADNELVLCARSLDALLEGRRPRPRWRAPMVANQRLNAFRTTLLGRTPGWSPPAAPIGPWRPVWLETRQNLQIGAPNIRARLEGSRGRIDIECGIRAVDGLAISDVTLYLQRADQQWSAALTNTECVYSGYLLLEHPALWWPHTHGKPDLYAARLEVALAHTGERLTIDLGPVGFRTLEVQTDGGDFAVRVNGERIFCRGACWTPIDCVSLAASESQLHAAIAQMSAAGMNMVRVCGPLVYESDDFLDACDAAGMLLWQDLMFANMDYSQNDAAFFRSVQLEASQILQRLSGRACVAVVCGNSECEQQAAMWGVTRDRWGQEVFERLLRDCVLELAPDTQYWPSSAHGGDFPHQINVGTVSYYGVGAYLRPLTDARRSEMRFATECLAFANVSEDPSGEAFHPKVHSPAYKARVPRDLGAGWDFDDVRDHYLREIFHVDPLALRYAQHERYLALSRAVSGEVMGIAFREWRRAGSSCRGALVWFLRDLWTGSGWGLVDAAGVPKAPYFFLKRLLQPQTVFLTDEGGSGVEIHITNESQLALEATLEIALYRDGRVEVAVRRRQVRIAPRTVVNVPATALLDGFTDLTYAYRFGPPPCDLICATLSDSQRGVLARDFYFPLGHDTRLEADIGLTASARMMNATEAGLTVKAARAARFVTIHAPGFIADDQYFHLRPGIAYQVALRATGEAQTVRGEVQALNSAASCRIVAAD